MYPTKIKIKAGVRYWCDCQYSTDNGVTWNQPNDTEQDELLARKAIPCIKSFDEEQNWYWFLIIDFETGRIDNWKQGFQLKTFFKVCDDGRYQIINDTNNIIWDSGIGSYVPSFLEIDSSNYGDNIYITIDGEGTIKDWDIAKDRILELVSKTQGE